MFNFLAQLFRSGRRQVANPGRSPLRMESLESRVVLSANAGTVSMEGTVLSICGTDAGDTIVVAELQDNYWVSADFLSEPVLFPRANVSSLVVDAGGGNDTLIATSMNTRITLNGEDGNDRIFGGSANDALNGGAGDDLIYGNDGADVIRGGDGADRVFAGEGDDTVFGGDGDDILVGMDGSDFLHGDSGEDSLNGGAEVDFLYGGADADQLLGGAAGDVLYGGRGDDVIRGDGGEDRIFGDDGDDELFGNGAADTVFGGLGDDYLEGNNGDDQLMGGDGADRLFGNDGSDLIEGGTGDDELVAGRGADTIFGNDGNDMIEGGNGDDVLAGHRGQDTISGQSGRDVLIGGEDADVLEGNNGIDLVISGTTTHQLNTSLLDATRQVLLASGSGTYSSFISAVFSGFTVHDPLDSDTILGGNGRDAFHSTDAAIVQDRDTSESVVGADPVALNDSFSFVAGELNAITAPNGLLANDLSATGGTVALISGPTTGTLTLNADGSFDYSNNVAGTDSFVYEVTPVAGQPSQATVTITVDEIVASDDSFDIVVNETLTVDAADGVLANDNLRGTGATASLLTDGDHGSVTLNPDGSFTYDADEHARDSFTYLITNPLSGGTSLGTVDLAVPGIPELPVGATLTALASGTGVQIYDFEVGTGAFPIATTIANIDYIGYLPNGDIFDENTDIDFPLNGLIPGFTEGTIGMQVGGMRRIVIPPDQGYGPNGLPQAGIGGTDTIIFDVTLNSFT